MSKQGSGAAVGFVRATRAGAVALVLAGSAAGCVVEQASPGNGGAGQTASGGSGGGTVDGGSGAGSGNAFAGTGGTAGSGGTGGTGGSGGTGGTGGTGGSGGTGGTGGTGGSGGAGAAGGAGGMSDLSVSVRFPFLLKTLESPAQTVFPGYLAHLLGAKVQSPLVDPELVCVSTTNTGGTTKQVDVTVDLVGYATPLTKSIPATPGFSEHCMSPVPDLDKIYALTSSVPVVVSVKLRDVATGEEVAATKDATLTPSQTAFNGQLDAAGNPQQAYQAQAVFVTPQNAALQTFYTDVTKQSRWGTFAVGGYDMYRDRYTKPLSFAIPSSNAWHADNVYLEAGESVAIEVTQVACSACTTQSAGLLFLDPTQTAAFTNVCGPPVSPTPVVTGSAYTLKAGAAGWYSIWFVNGCDNFTDRQVTFHRTGSSADAAQDVLRATFETLKAKGVTYVNVASTFADVDATQTIRLPETSLTDVASNCIDGSVLFASVAEKTQLEPVIVYVPGHAFLGIRSAPGSELVWPVETTMVGTETWDTAFATAVGEYNGMLHLADIDVKAARAVGFAPMPQ